MPQTYQTTSTLQDGVFKTAQKISILNPPKSYQTHLIFFALHKIFGILEEIKLI